MSKFKSLVETFTYTALCAVCIIAGWSIIYSTVHKTQGPQSASQFESALRGKALALPVGNQPGKKVVVVAMTTECRFCLESVPLFRELGDRQGTAYSLLVASPEDPVILRTFLEGQNIRA